MNKKYGILLVVMFSLLSLFLIPFISAIDSISCVPSSVVQGGAITCEIDLAIGTTEKNQPYNITFYNDTGQTIGLTDCSFLGTTQNSPSPINVIGSCIIPFDWGSSTTGIVNFSLTGLDTSIIFQFNISAISSSTLLIDDFSFESPKLMGKQVGARWTVSKQDTGKAVLGASCSGDILQSVEGDLVPIAGSTSTFGNLLSKYAGHVLTSFFPIPDVLDEGTSYVVEVRCDCIPENGGCIDEDGNVLVNVSSLSGLIGIGTTSITIDTWITVNTLVDKTNYGLKDEIFICANVTNVISSDRISLNIFHQIRCSNGVDNNGDLDRILIAHDDDMPDKRGISINTTQMQCKKFTIPELKYLQGQTSECYASTEVEVLDETNSEIINYNTVSQTFNITSSELNLEPDWQWVSDKRLNSIVNLSDSGFNDYNGNGIGNIDLRIHFHEVGGLSIDHMMEIINSISNITIQNRTHQLIEHIDYELEFLEDGHIEIELRDVNMTKDYGLSWWNVSIDFYDLDLRSTEAQEDSAGFLDGINASAGTFDFSINAFDTETNIVVVNGTGVTGMGQVLNRDVEITCSVDGHPETQTSFTVFTTDSFSFSRSMDINLNPAVYTMRCTAEDSKFGRYVTAPATDNFKRVGSGGAVIEESGGVSAIDEIIDIIKKILKIVDLKVEIVAHFYSNGFEVTSPELLDASEENYNEVSFEIFGTNKGNTKIIEIDKIGAEPPIFAQSLISVSDSILPDERKLLFETGRLNIEDIGEIGELINFKINVRGIEEDSKKEVVNSDRLSFALGKFPTKGFGFNPIVFICVIIGIVLIVIFLYILMNKSNKRDDS